MEYILLPIVNLRMHRLAINKSKIFQNLPFLNPEDGPGTRSHTRTRTRTHTPEIEPVPISSGIIV